MDIDEEIKKLAVPDYSLPPVQKSTFEEYNKVICNRIKRINGELYMLYEELSQGESEAKHAAFWNAIQDFTGSEISGLHEKLKGLFYFAL